MVKQRTVADLNAQVAQVKADIARFEARLNSLTAEIGGRYGAESDNLIVEAAQLPIRIAAATRFLDEMAGQLVDAQRAEALVVFKTLARQRVQDAKEFAAREQQILIDFQKLESDFLKHYSPALAALTDRELQLDQQRKICETAGISRNEIAAMEAEYPWVIESPPLAELVAAAVRPLVSS